MFKVACVVWCAFHSVSTFNIIHFERGFKSNRVHLTRLLPKLPELLLILCPILSSLFKWLHDWPGPISNSTLSASILIPGFVFQFYLDWLGPFYMFTEGSHSMIEFNFFYSLRKHSLARDFRSLSIDLTQILFRISDNVWDVCDTATFRSGVRHTACYVWSNFNMSVSFLCTR